MAPMIRAVLPPAFRPVQPPSLVRLGRAYDGGYLIDSRDIMASDSLVSLGVYDDWSFERAFVKQRNVPVLAYDGSIDGRYFAQRIYRSVVDRHPKVFLKSIALLADYLWFFSGRRRHVKSFVASDTLVPSVSLAQVFDRIQKPNLRKPLLKIDIEGAEYKILDELVARADATAALAIEFHDCDQHLEEIERFIERYPLRLVHIHANNFGEPVSASGIPYSLELTFSSSPQQETDVVLPHPLDMPNKRGAEEVAISFAARATEANNK